MNSKDKIVLNFLNQQIKNSDLDRLEPVKWLNDSIINFYISILKSDIFLEEAQRFYKFKIESDFYCLNTFFGTEILEWLKKKIYLIE